MKSQTAPDNEEGVEAPLLKAVLASIAAELPISLLVVSPSGEVLLESGPRLNLSLMELETASSQCDNASKHGEHQQRQSNADILYCRDGKAIQRFTQRLEGHGKLFILRPIDEVLARRTELAAALEHLQILTAQQDALLNTIPIAHLLLSEKNQILSINRFAEELFDYETAELIDEPATRLACDPQQWPQRQRLSSSALAANAPPVEMEGLRKDGTVFPMSVAMRAIDAPLGPQTSVLIEDLTETHRRRNELKNARLQAEAASRVKSEFLANMSHEIRTPMNGMLGMLTFLLDTDLTAEQKECAKTAYYSADRLLSVINDILDFSKMAAGKMELETVEFSLSRLVATTVEILQSQFDQKQLRLEVLLDSSLAEAFTGDEARIRQVIVEFLSNAAKFTANGTVCLSVTRAITPTPHPPLETLAPPISLRTMVRFEVSDEGIGIASDRMNAVFQKFTQAERSTPKNYGGTGLGLAIAKQIVNLMNGTIGLESTLDVGSTFWCELPLEEVESPHKSIGSRRGVDPSPNWKAQILVVEDNLINQKVARRYLERLGCTVTLAANGLEALKAVYLGEFDLIFMDCQMPEMNGYQATRALRARQSARTLPIVAMTANALAGDREKCLSAGMNDFITKPVSQPAFVDVLEKWLHNSK